MSLGALAPVGAYLYVTRGGTVGGAPLRQWRHLSTPTYGARTSPPDKARTKVMGLSKV